MFLLTFTKSGEVKLNEQTTLENDYFKNYYEGILLFLEIFYFWKCYVFGTLSLIDVLILKSYNV
jgi:hypothetical protein